MFSDLLKRFIAFLTTDRAVDAARAAALLLMTALIARIAGRATRRVVALRGGTHRALVVGRLTAWSVFVLGAAGALEELGFKLNIVLGAAGLATIAIGLAAQTTLASLLSGFFLYGERPFHVGDQIEIDGVVGEVLSLDMMATQLRTFDNRFVRIPNELLVKAKLINHTRFPLRRLDLTIPIGHQVNFQALHARLLELADKNPLCLAEPAPKVFIAAFNETNTQLQLWLWTRTENLQELKATMTADIHHALEAVKRGTAP